MSAWRTLNAQNTRYIARSVLLSVLACGSHGCAGSTTSNTSDPRCRQPVGLLAICNPDGNLMRCSARTVYYCPGLGRDVSAEATWTSSDPTIIALRGSDVVAVGLGDARVIVTYANLSASV